MNSLNPVQLRRELLKLLLINNENTKIRIAELTAELNEYFPQAIGGFTAAALRKDLTKLREARAFNDRQLVVTGPGKNAKVDEGIIELSSRNFTAIEEEEKKNQGTKYRLGEALWFHLFGLKAPESTPDVWSSFSPRATLSRRISALRKRSNPSMFIDSGSTTTAAVRALLNAPDIPLRVEVNDGATGKQIHLVRPCLVTNCVSIADLVARSRHRISLLVRLIGGDLLVDRGSIAGALTDQCLRSWQLNTDIAIIGATGSGESNGLRAFGCSDRYESTLKSTMLENSTLIKVVLLDSSKLVSGLAPQFFAALTQVDLIVTDLGTAPEAKDAVTRLNDEAKDANVSILVVQPSPDDS